MFIKSFVLFAIVMTCLIWVITRRDNGTKNYHRKCNNYGNIILVPVLLSFDHKIAMETTNFVALSLPRNVVLSAVQGGIEFLKYIRYSASNIILMALN